MIEHLKTFYYLSTYLINFFIFCFLYMPLFNSCNIKKKIKKNGKIKIVSRPKIILAFTYLILLYFLFKCFTFRMIMFVIISLITIFLFIIDKMTPKLDEHLHWLNKFGVLIVCWKLLHTFFTIMNVIIGPIFLSITNYAENKLTMCKNFITQVANLSSFDSSNIDGSDVKIQHKNNSEISNISDYVNRTNKSSIKKKITNSKSLYEKKTDDLTNDKINGVKIPNIEQENAMLEIIKKMEEPTDEICDNDMAITFTEIPN